jgi:DNA-binding beta-propeller fold protein YncE
MTARRSLLLSLLVGLTVAGLPVTAQGAGPRHASAWTPWSAPTHGRLAAMRSMASTGLGGSHGGVGRVPVPLPQTVGLSPVLRTVYLTGDTGEVTVIDADRCNARRTSGCDAPVATMSFDPNGTADVLIDDATLTGYVTNPATGTVSLFDASRCNARRTSGCADSHVDVTTGGVPIGLAFNARTRTLYVGNVEPFVSVVDVRACNRFRTSGCSAAPASVTTLPGAVWPTVDEATNTIYAPEQGPEEGPPGDTVAVIDGARCNASVISGCGQDPARATAGTAPALALVDPRTRTLYVENAGHLDVSVFDAATCNARDTSGCAEAQATVQVGNEPNSSLVIDQSSRTLFVVNTGSDTISAVDVRDCRAGDVSGCARRDLTIQTRFVPFFIELDVRTGTLYVPEHLDGDVAAFDVSSCNSRRRSGCRDEAPIAAIPDGVWATAADPDTHTLYAGGGDSGKLSLLDTRDCRAGRVGGCARAPFEFQLAGADGSQLNDLLFDRTTHTLYAVDTRSDRLFVVDTATCNTARHGGCAPRATVGTGAAPFALALNPRTRALYVVNIDDGTVMLLDAAHCNATDTSGCAAAPATVTLEGNPNAIAVDPDTDTAYVSAFGPPIAVLHGAERVGTLDTQAQAAGLAIDRAAHTLYVANFLRADFEDDSHSVAVVDTRACNGLDQSGCDRVWPTTSVGRGPRALAVDPLTHRVFSANLFNATASVIDGARCNATSVSGCDRSWPRVAVGNIPLDTELALRDRTLYIANAPDREVSVIDLDRPCRDGCVP